MRLARAFAGGILAGAAFNLTALVATGVDPSTPMHVSGSIVVASTAVAYAVMVWLHGDDASPVERVDPDANEWPRPGRRGGGR